VSRARVILALTARPAMVLAVSTFLAFGTVALLLVWTFGHSARMRRQGEAATAATSRA
jgi:hypothetical protein